MSDCIFCKIVAGEIPSATVYEDDVVKVFMDITQSTPGHCLMIPKKHVKDIFEYDEALAKEVFARVPMIARAVKASNPKIVGLNILNNNGEAAYQTVFHSHIHFVPRYKKDGDGLSISFQDNADQYDGEKLKEMAAKIAENID